MDIIGRQVLAGGCTGILKGYRAQMQYDAKGRLLTPPDKRWLVVVDITDDKTVDDELVNYYPADVHFADTGALIPGQPESVAQDLKDRVK